MEDLLKSFFQSLDFNHPLTIEEIPSKHVNRSPEATKDPVSLIENCLEWEETGNAFIFSGLRGSGKTTELKRLMHSLQGKGIATFYCDAGDYLNLNDPQLSQSEVLLCAMVGLAKDYERQYNKNELQDSILQRIRRTFASDVVINTKIKAEPGGIGAEFDFSLKENTEFKKQLIDFSRSSRRFQEEIQKYAKELVQRIKSETSCKQFVLIVDSLERLGSPTGEELQLFYSLRDIYYTSPDDLRFPSMSVIYTAPPFIQTVVPNVQQAFSHYFMLPNFKVVKRLSNDDQNSCDLASKSPQDDRNQEGIAQMVEIISKRFPDWDRVIERDTLEHIAWMSGGNARIFMRMLRNLARYAKLAGTATPIALDAEPVNMAVEEEAAPMRALTIPDREWLSQFNKNNDNPVQHIRDIQVDFPIISRLFNHSLVLNYQNGTVWYSIPPLARPYVI